MVDFGRVFMIADGLTSETMKTYDNNRKARQSIGSSRKAVGQ
jgi:hypothetical protein